MTISNELNKLIQTKEAIRQSIINKGTDVDTDVPFSQYASKIDEIQTSPVEYMQPEFYELRTKGGTDYTGLFAEMSGDLDLSGLDTSTVESMRYAFYYNKCNLNCSNWDVSNVTDVCNMFDQFTGNINISNFSFDSLNRTYEMFSYANINNIIGINDVKFPNATSFESMFHKATGDSLDLSNWDISNVNIMKNMFDNFDGKIIDLSGWNTINVTDMTGVFKFAYSSNMEELIIPDWDMTNVKTSSNFFPSASYIAKLRLIDLSNSNDLTINKIISYLPARTETTYGDVLIPAGSSQEVIDGLIAKYWRPVGVKLKLDECTIAAELDEVLLGKSTKIHMGDYLPWYANRENNVEYVTSDNSIAAIDEEGNLTAHALGTVEVYVRLKDTQEVISNILTINVAETYTNPNEFKFRTNNNAAPTNYSINGVTLSSSNCTFNDVSKIWTHVPTGNITLMKNTGYSTCNISEIIKINTENITNTEKMFYYCGYINSLDASNLDVSNVKNMNNMFCNCRSLLSLNGISDWDISDVTDMTGMFGYCVLLETLNLSKWNVANVTNMNTMFTECSSLVSLDISNWDISNVKNTLSMFSGCKLLTYITCNVAITINKLIRELGRNDNGTIYTTCDPSELDMETIQSKGWTVEKLEPANTIKFLTKGSKQLVVNGEDVTALVEEVPSEVMLLSTDQPVLCKYIPNGDITSVSFAWNEDLIEVIQLDTSKVENMSSMFYGCSSLQTIPDLDVTNAKWMDGMFEGCINLTGYADPEKYWDNPNIISSTDCFKGCTSLSNYNELPSNWGGIILLESISLGENVSTTEDTYQLVCTFIPEDTTQRNIEWMIDENSTVATLDQNGLLTRIGYGSVWVGCRSLDVADVVHHIEVTFEEVSEPDEPEIVLGNPREVIFKTKGSKALQINDSYVTNEVEELFTDTNGLVVCKYTSPDDIHQARFIDYYYDDNEGMDVYTINTDLVEVIQLDTSYVGSPSYMFYGCTSLESVVPLKFNNPIANTEFMFANTKITSLDMSEWNFTEYDWGYNGMCMISGCKSLTSIHCNSPAALNTIINDIYNALQMGGDVPYSISGDIYTTCLQNELTANASNLDDYTNWNMHYEVLPMIFKTRGNSGLTLNGNYIANADFDIVEQDADTITYKYVPSENITSISFANNEDLVEIVSLDIRNVSDATEMFMNCTSLNRLPELDNRNVQTMDRMFQGCSSMTGSVNPEHYWWKGVNSYVDCFKDCTMLYNYDEIPAEWKGVVIPIESIEMEYKFFETTKDQRNANAICLPDDTTQSEVLWSSSDETIATVEHGSVNRVGYGTVTITCTSAYNSDISDSMTIVFSEPGHSNITPVIYVTKGSKNICINGWYTDDYQDEIVDSLVEETLENGYIKCTCTPKDTITEISFDNGSDLIEVIQLDTSYVTQLNGTFDGCTSLQAIPDIDYSNIWNMYCTFNNCSSMTGYAHPDKFWNNPNVTMFEQCFQGCTSLDNYNDIPDDWKLSPYCNQCGNLYEECTCESEE